MCSAGMAYYGGIAEGQNVGMGFQNRSLRKQTNKKYEIQCGSIPDRSLQEAFWAEKVFIKGNDKREWQCYNHIWWWQKKVHEAFFCAQNSGAKWACLDLRGSKK